MANDFDSAMRSIEGRLPGKAQLTAAVKTVVTVLEAIREAGEIPAGTLYAILCGRMDHTEFESMMTLIVNTGLVTRDRSNLLRWVGPDPK
jgi:hypothetical protein